VIINIAKLNYNHAGNQKTALDVIAATRKISNIDQKTEKISTSSRKGTNPNRGILIISPLDYQHTFRFIDNHEEPQTSLSSLRGSPFPDNWTRSRRTAD